MTSAMMEMEQHDQPPLIHQHEPAGGELQLAIATTFSVAETGVDDFVIKQEPQEIVPEVMDEQPDEHLLFGDEAMEEEMPDQVYEEVSDVVLQRAVSPPTYIDPDEERIQELYLFYKEKYDLKDVTVELECCDKIWETFKMIKDLQNSSPCQFNSPKNSSPSQSELPGPFIPYQPMLGNDNKALPDFRFSVKSKKKLYHCITCGKEFVDSLHLKQHAIDEHGVSDVHINLKRAYKPRADQIAKTLRMSVAPDVPIAIAQSLTTPVAKSIPAPVRKSGPASLTKNIPVPVRKSGPAFTKNIPVTSEINKIKLVEQMENENEIPVIPPVSQPTELIQPQVKNTDNSISNEVKTDESRTKVNSVKEKVKIRCILCKRICTDIYYHMKGYHKVGCIRSIIAQCETITENNNSNSVVPPVIVTHTPIQDNKSITPEPMQIDLNESLAVAVKKRKRNTPRWTLQKRKFKPTINTTKNLNKITKTTNRPPFKCNVCLGIYKTTKSYSYHRKLHRIRGETPENFDPTRCRFLNSPLRVGKGAEKATNHYIRTQKETMKVQSPITNYISVQQEIKKSENEEFPQDTNEKMSNDAESGQTVCECGRSFRNYHTLYVHKDKCKGLSDKAQNVNDADSGIGISIKIKKNKNDSYEVVPRSTPTEECFKDSKSSKDSDISSNDSGMVSAYNNKNDDTELSKYSKGHSVLRIQVAEDDEEVDIEDGDSDHSALKENNDKISVTSETHKTIEATSSDLKENTVQNTNHNIRSISRRNNIVPSLTSLCKQVLSKSKQQKKEISMYKCQTCSASFDNKLKLMEHAAKMKHNIKSHCPCGKKFKNFKYFNIHVRRFHPLLLKCNYCLINFDRIEKYIEHACEILEGNLYIEPILQTQCTQCKELVDIGEPFDKHMKAHNIDPKTPYQCFKCELKFSSAPQRKSHFSKEHGFSVCRTCGKLLHVDHFSKHEAYHDGLGHPCHLCKKAFTQKALLRRHVQNTHDPFVNETVTCIVCSKPMRLRYLKKHMSLHLHTEICKKCNKCYRDDEQKIFEDHVALDHPNDYPTLKCDTCNITFISDRRYQEHYQEGTCKPNTNGT